MPTGAKEFRYAVALDRAGRATANGHAPLDLDVPQAHRCRTASRERTQERAVTRERLHISAQIIPDIDMAGSVRGHAVGTHELAVTAAEGCV